MKKIFSLIAMCLVSLSMMAQSQLVATLTHEGTTTEYYGANALQDALVGAQDGDLITLSAGTFVMRSGSFVFNKELIIRGNGMEGSEATIIDSPVQVEANENETLGLKIEGVSFNQAFNIKGQPDTSTPYIVEDVTLLKCKMQSIDSNPNLGGRWGEYKYHGTFKNLSIINCKCVGSLTVYNESVVSIINSIVRNIATGKSEGFNNNVNLTLDHSINIAKCSPDAMPKGIFRNSIINVTNGIYGPYEQYFKFNSASQFVNCIISGADLSFKDKLFSFCQNENSEYRAMDQVFKTCTNYEELVDDTYELTDEAKALLSTDGTTERGIYGGVAPYSSVVTYPHFTTFNVAEKAENGTLSVTIAAE